MLTAMKPRLVWSNRVSIESREELVEFHDEVSLESALLAAGVPPRLFVVGVPFGLYLVGAALSYATGRFPTFVGNPFVPVFAVDLFLVLATVIWLDRRGIEVILEIRNVFDTTDEAYYGFFGEMLERIYEPIRWSLWPSERRIHRATTMAYTFGIVAFLVVPHVLTPIALSSLTGTDWPNLPLLLQCYFLLLYLIVLGVGVLVGWVVSVGVVFMGWRITRFDVRLDVTRKASHLGLEPYSRLIFTAAFAYLLELVVSSVFVVREANVLLLVGYAIMTLIPVVGVFGGHYGLSRMIKRAKDERLSRYRTEFSSALQYWFTDDATSKGTPPGRVETFLVVKEEVENVPDWPFDTQLVLRLAIAVIGSNASILFRYFLAG